MIDTNVVQYFPGNTKHKNVTYYEWMEGNITGDVRNWPVSIEDRDKIVAEQKRIFDRLVNEKFEYLQIDGSIDLGIVPSEKQKVAVAGMNAKVDCMVQAYSFGKFLVHLESLAAGKVEEQLNGKISKTGVETLEHRFDEIKEEFRQVIAKGFENIDDTQHKLFYELQSGQQVIFEEFDELKDFLNK